MFLHGCDCCDECANDNAGDLLRDSPTPFPLQSQTAQPVPVDPSSTLYDLSTFGNVLSLIGNFLGV